MAGGCRRGRISVAAAYLCMLVSAVFWSAGAAEEFRSLAFIADPGQARIMFADSFNDGRILWLFPFLAFSRTNNITGWAFRVKPPSQQWRPTPENMPSFELWQESLATPALDYRCINCSVAVQSTEQYFEDNNSVYRQVLETPLVVAAEEQYILGIKIPPPGPENLHLAFQRLETPDRLSYFVGLDASFIKIRPQTYQDNLHVPLVSPIYDLPEEDTTPPPAVTDRSTTSTLSTSTGSVGETPVPIAPSSQTSSNTEHVSSVTPSLPTSSSPSSSQPPIALIVGSVVIGLVVVTLTLSVVVLLVKYHQLRFGKRDNPTYEGEREEGTQQSGVAYGITQGGDGVTENVAYGVGPNEFTCDTGADAGEEEGEKYDYITRNDVIITTAHNEAYGVTGDVSLTSNIAYGLVA